MSEWERDRVREMIDVARRDYFSGLPEKELRERIEAGETEARLRDLVRTNARKSATDANFQLISNARYRRTIGAQTVARVADLIFNCPAAKWYQATGKHDSARVIWKHLLRSIDPSASNLTYGLAAVIPGTAWYPLAALICVELTRGGYLKGQRKGAIEAVERLLAREAPRMADLGALAVWPKRKGELMAVAGLGDIQHEVSALVSRQESPSALDRGQRLTRLVRATSPEHKS